MVVLFVLDEVQEEEHMSEVDKAVSFVSLFGLSIVHGYCEMVEPSAMIHLKVLIDIVA